MCDEKSEADSKNRPLQHDQLPTTEVIRGLQGQTERAESTLSRNSIARRRSEASGGVSRSRARKAVGRRFFSLSDLLDKSMPAGGVRGRREREGGVVVVGECGGRRGVKVVFWEEWGMEGWKEVKEIENSGAGAVWGAWALFRGGMPSRWPAAGWAEGPRRWV